MTYQVIRTQPRDLPTQGIKEGDETVIHSGTKDACETMADNLNRGRPGQYRVVEAGAALQALAAAARPTSDEDWGSERQINAENAFIQYLQGLMPETFGEESDFAAFCLKATTDEMIDEALRLFEQAEG